MTKEIENKTNESIYEVLELNGGYRLMSKSDIKRYIKHLQSYITPNMDKFRLTNKHNIT